MKQATFAGGCFWCMEAVFQRIPGVRSVQSGYTGGDRPQPTYQEVCAGTTGHAEAIQITYDDRQLDYVRLLEIFFATHDPTTRNQQGGDVGSQYRSAVFYHDAEQQQAAEVYMKWLDNTGVFENPIVTELQPATVFYQAEEEHHDYYNRNPEKAYCRMSILPKLEKLRAVL